ncbi:MAG: hypothetical protein UU73_C0003G0289 [Candidatus Daviesbacteria bacterium GW2011_GWA1_41_61]|uniref:Uncharacterized protein n=1 Tax=Candidatus Daviesbacteria bacterium GW2011_GWA2_40_9 TaxID=1618424 RepID=A0A0G0U0U1_9BACT|nr:MAG: hypothetical protein UU26_C0018G0010 [Candidatus Daviesbacteria bacterium GW2011_GWC1_40_9]KKR82683.1 MAG: hypothetical protein UU29_C0010G0029 [Candidatus Daviesbacteria bacterium GW2011_GWA2_40_9]KKR93361.1 MAG: hypothetical protein UU44_C0002G0022 [Candidatus Daviesbacteria bacterium GW2011_GWB1_41_15]KKS15090.1 MAG: hypothetical protein UU73_C0003G0289 [Candidatus Daviesbacteria bacterium GW2011_GWA1_41_61]
MQKGFSSILILIGLIAVVVIVGSLLYFSKSTNNQPRSEINEQILPSTAPTQQQVSTNETGLKTYTNNKDYYSFSYPEDKYLLTEYPTEETTTAQGFPSEGKKSSTSLQYCPSKKLEDCAFPSNIFIVNTYENKQKWSIDTWLTSSQFSPIYSQSQKKQYCYITDPRTKIVKESFLSKESVMYTFFIDEATAKGVCKGEILEGGGEFKYVFVENGQQITVLSTTSASLQQKPELDQILSSFKFTQ